MAYLQHFIVTAARLSAWLLLLALIFLPLERLFALHPHKLPRKALATDLGYYVLSGIVPGLLLAAPLSLVAMAGHAVVPPAVQQAVAAWPLELRVAAGLVVGEVGFYWGHRWAHRFPLLWRFHAIHHSTEHLYFLASSRSHPVDSVFIRLCGLVPIYALGLASPLDAQGHLASALIVLVSTTWGFFIHANVRWRLGPLEHLIATPAFHHWHHDAERKHQNYASMLPWIDRLFGTHHLPRDAWPEAYGIDETLPDSLGGQLLYPLRTGAAPMPENRSRQPA